MARLCGLQWLQQVGRWHATIGHHQLLRLGDVQTSSGLTWSCRVKRGEIAGTIIQTMWLSSSRARLPSSWIARECSITELVFSGVPTSVIWRRGVLNLSGSGEVPVFPGAIRGTNLIFGTTAQWDVSNKNADSGIRF